MTIESVQGIVETRFKGTQAEHQRVLRVLRRRDEPQSIDEALTPEGVQVWLEGEERWVGDVDDPFAEPLARYLRYATHIVTLCLRGDAIAPNWREPETVPMPDWAKDWRSRFFIGDLVGYPRVTRDKALAALGVEAEADAEEE